MSVKTSVLVRGDIHTQAAMLNVNRRLGVGVVDLDARIAAE